MDDRPLEGSNPWSMQKVQKRSTSGPRICCALDQGKELWQLPLATPPKGKKEIKTSLYDQMTFSKQFFSVDAISALCYKIPPFRKWAWVFCLLFYASFPTFKYPFWNEVTFQRANKQSNYEYYNFPAYALTMDNSISRHTHVRHSYYFFQLQTILLVFRIKRKTLLGAGPKPHLESCM